MRPRTHHRFPRLIGSTLLLLLTLLVVACTSTPAATQRSTSTPPQNTPTVGATQQQTPVAGAVPVYVTLSEFIIISSVTAFHAGTPYYFVVSNRGHDTHELKIMPDKPDGTPLSPALQYKDTLFEIEPVLPGTTWTFNYTFSPSAPGRYEMACQMGRHYQAGMRLPIVVLG